MFLLNINWNLIHYSLMYNWLCCRPVICNQFVCPSRSHVCLFVCLGQCLFVWPPVCFVVDCLVSVTFVQCTFRTKYNQSIIFCLDRHSGLGYVLDQLKIKKTFLLEMILVSHIEEDFKCRYVERFVGYCSCTVYKIMYYPAVSVPVGLYLSL